MVIGVCEPEDRAFILVINYSLEYLRFARLLSQVDAVDVLQDAEMQIQSEVVRDILDDLIDINPLVPLRIAAQRRISLGLLLLSALSLVQCGCAIENLQLLQFAFDNLSIIAREHQRVANKVKHFKISQCKQHFQRFGYRLHSVMGKVQAEQLREGCLEKGQGTVGQLVISDA